MPPVSRNLSVIIDSWPCSLSKPGGKSHRAGFHRRELRPFYHAVVLCQRSVAGRKSMLSCAVALT